MKDYNSDMNIEIYEDLKVNKVLTLNYDLSINLVEFVYFLIEKRIRGFIIDDYLVPISDKNTLLEALYYQVGLFDMYDLNWDAFQEALEYYVKNNDCGIVLIFRNGTEQKKLLSNEFEILEEIIGNLDINRKMKNGIILG